MRIKEIQDRLALLETKRGTGQFDRLSFDQVERALFTRLRRLATAAGGIDALLTQWSAATDPEQRRLIARIRSGNREIAPYYRDLQARLS